MTAVAKMSAHLNSKVATAAQFVSIGTVWESDSGLAAV